MPSLICSAPNTRPQAAVSCDHACVLSQYNYKSALFTIRPFFFLAVQEEQKTEVDGLRILQACYILRNLALDDVCACRASAHRILVDKSIQIFFNCSLSLQANQGILAEHAQVPAFLLRWLVRMAGSDDIVGRCRSSTTASSPTPTTHVGFPFPLCHDSAASRAAGYLIQPHKPTLFNELFHHHATLSHCAMDALSAICHNIEVSQTHALSTGVSFLIFLYHALWRSTAVKARRQGHVHGPPCAQCAVIARPRHPAQWPALRGQHGHAVGQLRLALRSRCVIFSASCLPSLSPPRKEFYTRS